MTRRAGILLATLAAALAVPAAALAHANISGTYPKYRETLQEAPDHIELSFDQRVKIFPKSIVVVNADGKVVSGAPYQPADRRYVRANLKKLVKGPYTVRWYILSSDGHTVSGVYTFGVRYPAPAVTEAYGASGPTTTEHIVRWLYFAAFALLTGGLGFRLLVLRGPVPKRLERRFFWITGIGVVAVLELGILAFCLRAQDALRLPFDKFLYGDLSPLSNETRFGHAFVFMTLAYAGCAALLFLAWLTGWRKLLWPAFAITLLFQSGLSLSGHSAVDSGHSLWSQLADWIHLTAGTLWLGGLVMLAVAVWPGAPELRRQAFRRFSVYATGLVAALVGAGIYLSILRLPRTSDLWATGYGQVLIAKLALVALALAWGGFHNTIAKPALARPRSDGFLGRLRTSLVGEGAVGMAVLLAAAVLTDSKPPAPPPAPAPAAVTAVVPR